MVVGYDLDRRKIVFRNPGVQPDKAESEMSFECFEEARYVPRTHGL